MRLIWSHDLPADKGLRDTDLEGPIGLFDGKVWFGTADYEYQAEERSLHPDRRGVVLRLDAIDAKSGGSQRFELALPRTDRPACWTFIAERLLYCGPLLFLHPTPHVAPQLSELDAVAARSNLRLDPVLLGDRLIVADAETRSVVAYDLDTQRIAWSREFPPLKPYRMSEAFLFEGRIASHAPDGLHWIDPATGETADTVKFPKVDVLYSPVSIDGDVLVGYTNWSTGGVIRYDPVSGEIRWQYRRRFDGPASYRRIWLVGDVVVWIKGETELIGIDARSGVERWSYRAAPYLYGRVSVVDDDLVFGSAGNDGAVHVVNAESGQPRWTQFLKNGCEFYALHDRSIIVGDFDGVLRRLDLRSGRELDRVELGSQVVGDVVVADGFAYTVVWPTERRPAQVVGVTLKP